MYIDTEFLELIKENFKGFQLAKDILVELFRDDKISSDASTDPEQSPASSNPAPTGKYECIEA